MHIYLICFQSIVVVVVVFIFIYKQQLLLFIYLSQKWRRKSPQIHVLRHKHRTTYHFQLWLTYFPYFLIFMSTNVSPLSILQFFFKKIKSRNDNADMKNIVGRHAIIFTRCTLARWSFCICLRIIIQQNRLELGAWKKDSSSM